MIGEMQTCSLQTICLSSLGMYITFSSIVLSSKNTAYIGTEQYNSPLIYPCKKFPIESISILSNGTEQYIYFSRRCAFPSVISLSCRRAAERKNMQLEDSATLSRSKNQPQNSNSSTHLHYASFSASLSHLSWMCGCRALI